MTREEEAREASIDYQLSTNPRAISGDAFADFAREMNVNQSFIEGAKWADKTMIDKTCEWLEDNLQGGVHPSSIYGFIKNFKRAMEEQL